jgi:excisionase family DNA binding protein
MTPQTSSYANEVVQKTIGGCPMTLEEVGEVLRCSAKTIKREIQRGRLISAHIGGRWVIYPKDFAAYLGKARKV